MEKKLTIEQQVCTLEQAKRLKELGVEQNSYFVYRHWRGDGKIILSKKAEKYNDYPKYRRQVSPSVLGCAFTVAELLDMLPDPYSLDKSYGTLGQSNFGNPIYYSLAINNETFYAPTSAQVCALALIDVLALDKSTYKS